MLIFGKDTNDKGSQLEKLTGRILSTLGYRNITTNEIRFGGEEIDVRADYCFPGFDGDNSIRAICECKAHKNPIRMDDWLKFLGKVLSEECRANGQVYSCFIALSEVNGNVSGHYEDLKRIKPNITLLSGDKLFSKIEILYDIVSIDKVFNKIKSYTDRNIRSADILYYDDQFYWIIMLEDDLYTIIKSNAEIIERSEIENIIDMVTQNLSGSIYMDLKDEVEYKNKIIDLQKKIIIDLLTDKDDINQKTLESQGIQKDDINFALKTLIEKNWVNIQKNNITLISDTYPTLIDIYKFLFTEGGRVGNYVLNFIQTDKYLLSINDDIIEEIIKVKGDIEFTKDEKMKFTKF